VFLEYKGHRFTWEPAWNTFRPIERVEWDGKAYVVVDRIYCKDITDPYYGFGSASMKEVCDRLRDAYESRLASAPNVPPLLGSPTWFRDRRVVLSPCAPRDIPSWKRMCRGRVRTCRKALADKFTRRNRV
jgi:hypothetical protein